MNETPHREAERSKTLRGITRRGNRKTFRPWRGLFSCLFLLGFTLVMLYALILVAGRAEGVRQWVADHIAAELDAPVSLGGLKITASLDMVLESLVVKTPESETAGLRVKHIKLHFAPRASRKARAWVFDRLQVDGVELDLTETEQGLREPVSLTSLIGIHKWGDNHDREGEGTVLDRLRTPAEQTEEPADESKEKRNRIVINPENMLVTLSDVNIRLYDAEGTKQCEFMALRIGMDPGRDPAVTPATRYTVQGRYQMRRQNQLEPQPLHLEIVYREDTWHFIEAEAELRFLRWLGDVLSGKSAGSLIKAVSADGN
ncbi:MAG: hypothetical protein JJU29_15915 [Verrucomicrobia bacterium]|nr:hypothetical protein [Verrucomicrobiota bacterium]MCH8512674.1 hypothetical protein [Kiritimatiellia bacterium]